MAHNFKRGEIYKGNLNPQKGSEQAGERPVLIFQINQLNNTAKTTVVIPFTSQLKYRNIPSCVFVPKGEGGLETDSIALCHQIRVIDKDKGLLDNFGNAKRIGKLSPATMALIEGTVAIMLGLKPIVSN
ncbi:MAG: type II toxin-antitoxin system PemK/MazF family toxin [Acidobacteria bacterium]|nr:type II toxin-antitoxin system PemK/MazF family toxin [Acidobacteriota bacterium]